MRDTQERRCEPCSTDTPALCGGPLAAAVRALDRWELVEGRAIVKEYRFPDFKRALDFAVRVGEIAERNGHHPEMRVSWGRVRLRLSTHKSQGLTANDIILAEDIDRIEAPAALPPAD